MEHPHTEHAPLGGMKRLPRLSDREKIRGLLARLIGLHLHGKLTSGDLKTLTYSLSELHRITETSSEEELPPYDPAKDI